MAHGGNAGLCFHRHVCDNCREGTGECVDGFEHPICGPVACDVGADKKLKDK